ncbi:hypothetical protein GCM10009677_28970 [Sphaerisporangium rubeum]|uniref:Uncharacterized protein n=1 Tax=Sphaerisporangium rubeum TaxID=321317 RepID=A0A7X0IAC6_9ACTN|nr:hypothetical protein [Sphaerisporangium rubeum]MBB6471415.1 hypothetical protein [Sphaerisporangium rubeum]
MTELLAEDALVTEVARVMVQRAAPSEVPIFDPLSRAYFADRKRALAGDDKGSGLLGFGVAEVAMLATPILLEASHGVVTTLIAEGLLHHTKSTIRQIRRLFGTDQEPEDEGPLPLTPEQWARVRDIVRDTAVSLGTPKTKADLLANAVVGRALLGDTLE